MANKGFALYKKEKNLYLVSVSYEYADTKFVGFSNSGDVYKINKLNEEQKEWIKYNDPLKNEKTKNLIFIGDYYVNKVFLQDLPKGRLYTQLPGGGGVYKETRKYNYVYDIFKNPTILKAIENYGIFTENYNFIRNLIKETIENWIYIKKNKFPELSMFGVSENKVKLKQESPLVGFTAISIEDEKEKNKINKIFNLLKNKGLIPVNFIRPEFPDGTNDYHMTIKLGELSLGFKKDLNKEVTLVIDSIGISDSAVALGVSGEYFSFNEFQHITLAFKDMPESSKNIKNWKQLKKPFKIIGVVREFSPKKQLIKRGIFDETNQIQVGNFQINGVSAGAKTSFPMEKK